MELSSARWFDRRIPVERRGGKGCTPEVVAIKKTKVVPVAVPVKKEYKYEHGSLHSSHGGFGGLSLGSESASEGSDDHEEEGQAIEGHIADSVGPYGSHDPDDDHDESHHEEEEHHGGDDDDDDSDNHHDDHEIDDDHDDDNYGHYGHEEHEDHSDHDDHEEDDEYKRRATNAIDVKMKALKAAASEPVQKRRLPFSFKRKPGKPFFGLSFGREL